MGHAGFAQQQEGDEDQEKAEGSFELPFRQGVGVNRAQPGGEDGGRGQEGRGHKVHRPIE